MKSPALRERKSQRPQEKESLNNKTLTDASYCIGFFILKGAEELLPYAFNLYKQPIGRLLHNMT